MVGEAGQSFETIVEPRRVANLLGELGCQSTCPGGGKCCLWPSCYRPVIGLMTLISGPGHHPHCSQNQSPPWHSHLNWEGEEAGQMAGAAVSWEEGRE